MPCTVANSQFQFEINLGKANAAMKRYIRLFFRRISKDFKQKQLLPVKFLFFIQMSTILVLYPYLTIHMRELGINVEETAIMSAVTPVIGILMPPVAGMLADKIGNFRLLLASFSALGGLSALLLLLVPTGRVKITYPDNLVVGFSCSSEAPLSVIVPEDFYCNRASEELIENVPLKVESCGYVCTCPLSIKEMQTVELYRMKYTDSNNKTSQKNFYVSTKDTNIPTIEPDLMNHLTFKINQRYETAFRRFMKNSYYFPSRDFSLSCKGDKFTKYNTTTHSDVSVIELYKQRKCGYFRGIDGLNNTLQAGLIFSKDFSDNQTLFEVKYLGDKLERVIPICTDDFTSLPNETLTIELYNNHTKVYDSSDCELKCIATTRRKYMCSNNVKIIEKDIEFTFWTYLSVRVFVGIIGGTSYTMFEGAVIAILREYKADYGLQRMYASIGGMISSPLSGWLIDFASSGKDYTDFKPVFFLYAILKVISAGMMVFINLEFKTPATSVVSDVLSVLNIELMSLFVASFLLGSAWGYIESFLFWLLQDLGGSKSLMGLTITVGGLIGIPILVLSGPLIKRLGHANVIFIGFVTYAIRLLGYSLIYNPWLSLIFEAMECFTHSLCFTAAVTYAARLSTVTTDTTIQGIFGGLFYGVGKSFGSLVGGYLIKLVGMRQTFQVFALTTGITGFVYLAFYHLYMKKRSSLIEKPKEETNKPTGFDALTKGVQTENSDKIKSVPYEDSLTNMAFEDTEGDLNITEDENEDKQRNEPRTV